MKDTLDRKIEIIVATERTHRIDALSKDLERCKRYLNESSWSPRGSMNNVNTDPYNITQSLEGEIIAALTKLESCLASKFRLGRDRG